MKKITVKKEDGSTIVIYLADDALTKITDHDEKDILSFLAEACSSLTSSDPVYLQFAVFNPHIKNQLQIYYSRGQNKDIIVMKPDYVSKSFKYEISEAAQADFTQASETIKNLSNKAKKALNNETKDARNAPISKEDMKFEYAAQNSPEKQKELAKKLLTTHFKKATDDNSNKFSKFIFAPDDLFSTATTTFEKRYDIEAIKKLITEIEDRIGKTNDKDHQDIRQYLNNINEKLTIRINATNDIPNTIKEYSNQLLNHADAISIRNKINTYTSAKDDRNAILAKLTAAIYNAAKNYYLSLWNHEKLNLDDEIKKFNGIFVPYVKINLDDYSMTSIEGVFKEISKSDVNESALNNGLTSILNNAYDSNKTDRDAIEFIIKSFNNIDPDHKQFPVINRLTVFKHAFSFTPAASKQLQIYDAAYAALNNPETTSQVKTVYITGKNLVRTSNDLAKSNSQFGGLDTLSDIAKTVSKNLKDFEKLINYKKKLDDLDFKLDMCDLGFLNIPKDVSTEVSDAGTKKDFEHLSKLINEKKQVLSQDIINTRNSITDTQEFMYNAINKAKETSQSLLPISDVKNTLDQTEASLLSIGDALNTLDNDIKISKTTFSPHTNLLKILSRLKKAEGSTDTIKQEPFPAQDINILSNASDLEKKLNDISAIFQNENDSQILDKLKDEYSHLTANTRQRIDTLKENITKIKKDTYDILQCQLLVNALMYSDTWKSTTGTFGIQASVTIDGQSSIVPREIGGMLEKVKNHEGWDSNPHTARMLIAALKTYAGKNDTSNNKVTELYTAINAQEPADHNTLKNNIRAKLDGMGSLLPQQPTRITDAQINDTIVTSSRFWQRHPVLKKALLGALIGTIIPVVGTIIGLIVGTVIGKRDEKQRQQQPKTVASNKRFDQGSTGEEQKPLLNNSTDTLFDDEQQRNDALATTRQNNNNNNNNNNTRSAYFDRKNEPNLADYFLDRVFQKLSEMEGEDSKAQVKKYEYYKNNLETLKRVKNADSYLSFLLDNTPKFKEAILETLQETRFKNIDSTILGEYKPIKNFVDEQRANRNTNQQSPLNIPKK